MEQMILQSNWLVPMFPFQERSWSMALSVTMMNQIQNPEDVVAVILLCMFTI